MNIWWICILLVNCTACITANQEKRSDDLPAWQTITADHSQKIQELTSRLTVAENQLRNVRKSVAFHVQHGVDHFSVASQGKITYDAILLNTGNGYDALNGIFRAPSAGLYVFFFTCMAEPGSEEEAYIVVNGQIKAGCFSHSPPFSQGSNTITIHLAAGTPVWVQIYQNAENIRGELWNTFGGFLLQADD